LSLPCFGGKDIAPRISISGSAGKLPDLPFLPTVESSDAPLLLLLLPLLPPLSATAAVFLLAFFPADALVKRTSATVMPLEGFGFLLAATATGAARAAAADDATFPAEVDFALAALAAVG
jgi:hypothetical protein